ncbi:MAG: shikimate kinase [Tyzzerella sp.]|nr:shikimate kinase [Tyzzerella sp.]
MKNIIFIGMPASGKSTVGVVVAKRLGYDFIDTDLLIQKQEKRLLKEIIADVGNDGFLAIENQVNREVEAEHAVISPGGSVVYCKDAMEHFKEIGKIVYLKVSYETINRRISSAKNRGVVLKEGQTLRDLYEERTKLFEKYADYIVSEEGLSLEETIDEVLELFDK